MPELSPTAPGRYGASPPRVTLTPLAIAWAWNVQGLRAAGEAQRALGVALPQAANTMSFAGEICAAWLGPESWLLVSGAPPASDLAATRARLDAAGAALFDVSAGRVAGAIAGPRATDVLAAGCPLDFHPRTFPPGSCAQSLYAGVNVLVCRPGAEHAFVILVARSFGRDVWQSLCSAALEFGYAVEPAAPWCAQPPP